MSVEMLARGAGSRGAGACRDVEDDMWTPRQDQGCPVGSDSSLMREEDFQLQQPLAPELPADWPEAALRANVRRSGLFLAAQASCRVLKGAARMLNALFGHAPVWEAREQAQDSS